MINSVLNGTLVNINKENYFKICTFNIFKMQKTYHIFNINFIFDFFFICLINDSRALFNMTFIYSHKIRHLSEVTQH
jgi:hypothetical protein